MALYTYDRTRVVLNIGGFLITGGPEEGAFVKIEVDDDDWKKTRGLNTVVRSKIPVKTAKVTVRLLSVHTDNAKLTGIQILDKANGGVVPIALADTNGAEVFVAAKAWCLRSPMLEYGAEAPVREWVFDTAECEVAPLGYPQAA
jgi:hypothetical protein